VEVTLFGDPYVRFSNYFVVGTCIQLKGSFEKWESRNEWNFRVSEICLLETIKRVLTRQLQMTIQPGTITKNQLDFFTQNMKKYPGKARLKVIFLDQIEKLRVQMKTTEKGFEMNDELTEFLEKTPEIEVQVDFG
jgi:DNA polymerase-3 subunit alpha